MEKIRIENLSFRYPESKNDSLRNVNLRIAEGEYIALIGRSGSGKTTLLQSLKPSIAPRGKKTGEIYVGGKAVSDLPPLELASKIGFVMQNPESQIVTDKVYHEMAFGLESMGLDGDTIRLKCAETAEFFGITEWFSRDTDTLSGGQKQLLNLASVMVMNPEILILDEPVSQLDPIAAADFLRTVKKINIELGVTVIITEHRLEEIFSDADKIAVIENGEIISFDTPSETGRKSADELKIISCAMPAPVRIYSSLSSDSVCPVTVREGIDFLKKTVGESPEFKRIERQKDENGEVALKIKNVSFRYEKNGKTILDDVNVKFLKGKITAILGGNGAGKSTLLKIIAGIYKPVSGKVKNYSGKISYLPQNTSVMFSENTVRDDLLLFGKNIDDVVALTGIEYILDRHPRDVSGGEMQKAATAKILLTKPDILLLDEPTKGFDGGFKAEFAKILKKITESGRTVIMVSHDVEFCAEYADRCMMLFAGQTVSDKSSGDFFSGNNFYTTAACRMSRCVFENAVTAEEVVSLCRKNLYSKK